MKGYQSARKESSGEADSADQRQSPQKPDLAILIGEFEDEENKGLPNRVLSFYKQFLTSEEAIYFFKYEEHSTFENQIARLFVS